WSFAQFLRYRLRGRVNRMAPLVTLPLGPWRKHNARQWRSVRTCNLGVWRADLDLVDGQDGAYWGWGPHDSDLAVRLIRSGILRKDGRYATGVLHLAHPPADRSRLKENHELFTDLIASDRVLPLRGFSALRAERQPAESSSAAVDATT